MPIHVPEIENRNPETRNPKLNPETISGPEIQTGISDAIFSITSDPIWIKIQRLDSPRPGLSNRGKIIQIRWKLTELLAFKCFLKFTGNVVL